MRIEIRNDKIVVDGYVNAVGRDSRKIPNVKGKFVEQIVPNTFKRALEATNNVDILLNHDKSRKLGSIQEGNLELFEDSIGLRAIATITDSEVIEKARKKQLRGWSFGFYVDKDRWEDIEEGLQRRFVEGLQLTEVSIVDNTMLPAYVGTSIETRANKEELIETRSLELDVRTVDNSIKTVENPTDNSKYLLELLKLKKH